MIEDDLENIKVYNFYGPENLKLNFKKSECQKHDYFILSSQKKNFEAINNSLKYLENIKSFDTFFSKFLKLKEICIDDKFDELLVDIYNSGQFGRSFLIEASEVKKAKIDVMNTCFFIYSLLLMPRLNKTNCCKHFDFFGNLLIEAFKSSLYFLKSAEDNIKNSQKKAETLKADLMKKLENAIQIVHFKLEDLELNNVFLPVYEIKIKIESLDEFVKDVLEKGNINTQIILDCDVRIIDIFVISFSSLLIEYCNVLEGNIAFNFSADDKLEPDVINTKYVNSGEFYHDVFIAKEMKKYLLSYQNDKIDFLIFSETYYFKFRLADVIENVLKKLLIEIDLRKIEKSKIEGKAIEQSNEDMEMKKRIIDLKSNWRSLLLSFGELDDLTFVSIIDKLSKKETDVMYIPFEADVEDWLQDKIVNKIMPVEQTFSFNHNDQLIIQDLEKSMLIGDLACKSTFLNENIDGPFESCQNNSSGNKIMINKNDAITNTMSSDDEESYKQVSFDEKSEEVMNYDMKSAVSQIEIGSIGNNKSFHVDFEDEKEKMDISNEDLEEDKFEMYTNDKKETVAHIVYNVPDDKELFFSEKVENNDFEVDKIDRHEASNDNTFKFANENKQKDEKYQLGVTSGETFNDEERYLVESKNNFVNVNKDQFIGTTTEVYKDFDAHDSINDKNLIVRKYDKIIFDKNVKPENNKEIKIVHNENFTQVKNDTENDLVNDEKEKICDNNKEDLLKTNSGENNKKQESNQKKYFYIISTVLVSSVLCLIIFSANRNK